MKDVSLPRLLSGCVSRLASALRVPAVVLLPVTLGAASMLTSACTTEVVNHVVASPEQQGISVMGSGKMLAAPDIAVINIGVETWAGEPKAAVDENTKQMTALVGALKQLGIAEADLQTSNFSIRFERNEPQPWTMPETAPAAAASPNALRGQKSVAPAPAETAPPAPESKRNGAFLVSNTLNVTVRELAKLGEALSSATAAGANSIWGVEFRISDPEPLMAQARDKAVADALAKAKRLAEISGVKLGNLVNLEESGRAMPAPSSGMYFAKVASVPVEAGTLEVVADVTLRFALE